jgi:pectate lyase
MTNILNKIIVKTMSFCLLLSIQILSQPVAFPGAEGFGSITTGGRGGAVIEVTTLDDSGSGSLREALEQTNGPRTVVFKVSGNIELKSRLKIKYGFVTIAGQTAPGDGICLQNYTVEIDADNVIVRYIRFRLGDEAQQEADSFWGREHSRIIIDHCTMSWSIDECASFYDNRDFTMQWCLISESLDDSYHSKGAHGYGGIWGGAGATFHHNLFAHHKSRNPRFNGSRYSTTPENEIVDFVNNVIYNWGSNSAYGGESGNINMRYNYYKYGPATNTGVRGRIIEPYDNAGNWYVEDNFVVGYPDITADNWDGGVQGGHAAYQKTKKATEPFGVVDIDMQSAEEAYESVLEKVGANFPTQDSIDVRIIEEVKTGTATYGKGIIDSQLDVGGYTFHSSSTPPSDRDHDGMPDAWEEANGLNPDDDTDRNLTDDVGYTMLENYMNGLVDDGTTSINEVNKIPNNFNIIGNYPNPFNPTTEISYAIPTSGNVKIKVYDIQGGLVDELYSGFKTSGIHSITWKSRNLTNGLASTGIYFCVIQFENQFKINKMLLLK